MSRTTFSGPVMVGPKPIDGATPQVGQTVLVKYVPFTFADTVFSTTIPEDAQILEVYVDVLTVWNSVTSDVIDIGDGNTANQFADNLNLQTAGRLRATSDVSQLANYEDIGANRTITGTITSAGGSLSTGDARLVVLYTLSEPAQT